jgi:hypothetical protein
MTSPRVRYYADANEQSRHEQILDLLAEIDIPTEITRVEIRHDEIGQGHETKDRNEAYRRLRIHGKTAPTMGVNIEDIVRIEYALPGRVAILLDDESPEICYVTPATHRLADSVDADDWRLPVTPVSLLMALRDDEEAVLSKIKARKQTSDAEERILNQWLGADQTPIKDCEREVWVGPRRDSDTGGVNVGQMRADGLKHHDDGAKTIIEVKTEWRGRSLQTGIGQLCIQRSLVEQFGDGAGVGVGAVLVVGNAEWSPEWGWPGATRAVAAACREDCIRIWVRDEMGTWRRLNDYL